MKNNKFHKTPHKFIMGLGQKPPNNKKYKLMVFVSYIYIFLCLGLTVWICQIFFIFYNMQTYRKSKTTCLTFGQKRTHFFLKSHAHLLNLLLYFDICNWLRMSTDQGLIYN
jgi:hypothetical protein